MTPWTVRYLHNNALENRPETGVINGFRLHKGVINGNQNSFDSSDRVKDIANPLAEICKIQLNAKEHEKKPEGARSFVRWDRDKFVQPRWGPACLVWTCPRLPQWTHRMQKSVGEMTFIDGTTNAHAYTKNTGWQVVSQSPEAWQKRNIPEWWQSKAQCQNHQEEKEVKTMTWPSISPELTTTEQLLGILKRDVEHNPSRK